MALPPPAAVRLPAQWQALRGPCSASPRPPFPGFPSPCLLAPRPLLLPPCFRHQARGGRAPPQDGVPDLPQQPRWLNAHRGRAAGNPAAARPGEPPPARSTRRPQLRSAARRQRGASSPPSCRRVPSVDTASQTPLLTLPTLFNMFKLLRAFFPFLVRRRWSWTRRTSSSRRRRRGWAGWPATPTSSSCAPSPSALHWRASGARHVGARGREHCPLEARRRGGERLSSHSGR